MVDCSPNDFLIWLTNLLTFGDLDALRYIAHSRKVRTRRNIKQYTIYEIRRVFNADIRLCFNVIKMYYFNNKVENCC